MIQITPNWRVLAGGFAAGFIGVMVVAGGRAAADPAFPPPPAPAPGPAQAAAPPAQNAPVLPGGTNRFLPTPPLQLTPAPAPAGSPLTPSPAAVSPMPPSVTPPITGTLREYLQAKGVKLEPQRPQGFNALDITLPVPTRWTQVPDPNVPDAFVVIADRVGGNSVYTSNAQVVVYKLIGNFDAAEAITHGFVDSQQLLVWQTTNASLANFGGFPSSIIEGTYRENDMTLNTSRRHVIASSGPDRYLVSLSVTTAASQAVADAPATDAIVNGFRVTVPGADTPAPAAPAPAPAAPAPVVAAPAPVVAAPAPAAPAPTQTAGVAGVAGQPLVPTAPAPAPVGLPRQMPVPSQAPGTGPMPNLLTLIPGLPPLPNLHITSQR